MVIILSGRRIGRSGYLFPRESLASKVVERIKAYGFKELRIGFERYFVDFAVYDGLRQAFPEASFTGASDLFYRLRFIKEPAEVDLLRRAAAVACQGMEAAVESVRPGVTELDILAEAEYAMLKAGSGGSSFRPQVVSGERALLTHPCASNKKIAAGEVVVIHLGATYEGYCAKMCRTVAVGEIPLEQERVYQVLLEAQGRAIAALRPGATAVEVDAAAREVVAKAGYGDSYLDLVGYGVGLRQSEFYPINKLAPSSDNGLSDKMGIDATAPLAAEPGRFERIRIPGEEALRLEDYLE